MKGLALVFLGAFVASTVNAESLPINPGLWETTMTRTDPFGGEPVTETQSKCVTETSFDPATMMDGAQGCAISQDDLEGNKLTFAMECDTHGAKSTMNGMYETDGQTGTGDMEVQVKAAGMDMSMQMRWTTRRTGDC